MKFKNDKPDQTLTFFKGGLKGIFFKMIYCRGVKEKPEGARPEWFEKLWLRKACHITELQEITTAQKYPHFKTSGDPDIVATSNDNSPPFLACFTEVGVYFKGVNAKEVYLLLYSETLRAFLLSTL